MNGWIHKISRAALLVCALATSLAQGTVGNQNGWFPKLRADGSAASGNKGIWFVPAGGTPRQVDSVGIGPILAGQTLVYNRNNNTTQVGTAIIPVAYNDYVGSDIGQWAGFTGGPVGQIVRYNGTQPIGVPIIGACAPRFFGGSFGYLTPYQATQRVLVVDGVQRASGIIIDWVADRGGSGFTYVTATGTYTKNIFDDKGNNITIRPQQDEVPIVMFLGPDGYPWMLSGTTNSGTFVRMIYSAFGYVIPGELYNPDARIIGDRLHVVGSLSNGAPRDVWIDFTAPKVDLRLV